MTVTAGLRRAGRVVPADPTLRLLALGTFVNRAGGGAIMTTLALYFTRVEGMRATEVGAALSIGALAGLLTQVPVGHLGDQRGPRGLMAALQAFSGLATLGLVFTHSVPALIVVLAFVLGSQSGERAVRNGYIARIAPGPNGVYFKAYLRATTNLAISLGALLGGAALWIDRTWAYLAVFVIDAVSSVLTGLITTRLPALEPAPQRAEGEPRLGVFRDAPYVAVTVLTGIVALHFEVIEVGIPLWIGTHTNAPTQMVAILLLLNTLAITIFQVRMSRGTDTVASAALTMRRGCGWLAAAFCLYALSSGYDPTKTIVLLVIAAGVHVVGEMLTSGGQWGTTMGLAPAHRQGQYQGFAGLGFDLANVAGPSLIAWLCIDWGRPGWLVLAGLVLGAGVLMKPTCAWALRTRERYGAATASG